MNLYEVTFTNQEDKPITMYLRLSDRIAAMKSHPKHIISESKYKSIMKKSVIKKNYAR